MSVVYLMQEYQANNNKKYHDLVKQITFKDRVDLIDNAPGQFHASFTLALV